MQILTDGQTLFRSQANATRSTSGADLFGPLPVHLAPRGGAQWWGRFEANSWIALEVTTDGETDLEVELLDQGFRRLSRAVRRGPSWIAMAHQLRPGVVYVRVRNLGERAADGCLTLSVEKALRVAA